MPEKTQAQHITELDFNIAKIPTQFKQIESMVESHSKKIAKMIESGYQYSVNSKNTNKQLEAMQKQTARLEANRIKQAENTARRIEEAEAKSIIRVEEHRRKQAINMAAKIEVDRVKRAEKTAQKMQEIEAKSALRVEEFRKKKAISTAAKIEAEKAKQAEKSARRMEEAEIKSAMRVEEYKKKQAISTAAKTERLQIQSAAKVAEERVRLSNKVALEEVRAEERIRVARERAALSFKTAFYYRGIMLAKQFARETIETIKDVEFSVMEITRVLNDATLNVEHYTQSIFDIASQYGRVFDEAADITLRFAQSGYSASESLAMTEKTMLALNTAELNTEQATKSLIGIMQQWGLEAKDYEGLIDRINITADNFAITSQDLVDALLKSSSVAKVAGMSFEEVVAVLTTMKVASGAAGKEVGNAFKSILSYIQRPASLDAFESMGIEVYANKLTGELLPMMDILENMANKWNDVGKAGESAQTAFLGMLEDVIPLNEELAVAIGVEEDYANAIQETQKALKANDAESRKQATEAAGVYRKNYYIALMENFQMVQEVLNNMTEAEGYSMRENAKYMDTLTAKYNEFINSMKNLAYSMGQSGLLDLSKLILSIATGFVNLTNAGKMTLPVMTALGVALYTAFKKPTKTVSDLINRMVDLTSSMMATKKKQKELTEEEKKLANEIRKGNIQRLKTIGINAAFSAGVTLMIVAVSKLITSFQQYREELHRAEKQYKDTLKTIKESTDEKYRDIEVATQQVDILKRSMDAEGKSNLSKQTVLSLIKEINQVLPEVNAKYDANTQTITMNTQAIDQYIEKLREQIRLEAQQEELKARITEAVTLEGQIADQEKLVESTKAMIDSFAEAGLDISGLSANLLLQEQVLSALKSDLDATNVSVDEMANSFSRSSQEVQNSKTEVELYADAHQRTQEQISGTLSAIDELESAIYNLNEGQALSMEQALNLISAYPELASKIYATADGWYLETDALKQLTQAKYNELIAAEAATVATELEKMGMTDLANEMIKAKSATEQMDIATRLLKDSQDGLIGSNNALMASLGKIMVYSNAFKTPGQRPTSSSRSRGGGGSGKSWYDKEVEAFERLNRMGQKTQQQVVDFYRAMTKAANISVADRIKAEDKLYDAIKKQIEDALKAQEDALKKQKEAIEEQFKAQKEALENRKDAIEEEADAEIEALRKVEKENDRIRAKEEYERNRAAILSDLASAQARSGIDARKAEQQAKQRLEDLDREYKEKLEDYKIEDRIEAIEQEKQAQIDSIEAQIEALERQKEASIKSIDEQLEALGEKFNEQSIKMMAFSAMNSEALYNQYVNGFIEPMANGLYDGFSQAIELMDASALQSANNLKNIYYENAIKPITEGFSAVTEMAQNFGSLVDKGLIKQSWGNINRFPGVRFDPISSTTNVSKQSNVNINMNNNISSNVDVAMMANKVVNGLTTSFYRTQ